MALSKPAKRICSLLPSATEIVGRLGLADRLVCVTHECDVVDSSNNHESKDILDGWIESGRVARVTSSAINPEVYTQAKIDQLVSLSLTTGNGLYGVDNAAMAQQNPDLIITQELCSVCAPSTKHVASALEAVARERQAFSLDVQPSSSSGAATDTHTNQEAQTSSSSPPVASAEVPRVLSLEPQSLLDVGDSFLAVANACGEQKRGIELHKQFLTDLTAISDAVSGPAEAEAAAHSSSPKVFILEWLDPPFDAGHWVPEVLSIALGHISDTSCAPSSIKTDQTSSDSQQPADACSWNSRKSRRITWDDVAAADPDILVVACCGFDFLRNCADGQATLSQHAQAGSLRAVQSGSVFAVDGNRYLARPGPSLVQGAAAVAACIWYNDSKRMSALAATGLLPERNLMWGSVPLQLHQPSQPGGLFSVPGTRSTKRATGAAAASAGAARGLASAAAQVAVASGAQDIENAADACWSTVHAEAVESGDNFYEDPETKLMVMTELVHRSRGSCCGKACRHCPFMHDRVSLRARPMDISRPAWLVPRKAVNATLDARIKNGKLNVPNGTGASCVDDGIGMGILSICDPPVSTGDSIVSNGAEGTASCEIVVLLCGCSDSDLESAKARQKSGEVVVLMAPLGAESRKLDGIDMHARDACQRATAEGLLLVGVPVHAGGPTHEELLRDALLVAETIVAGAAVVRATEVKSSLGEAAERWQLASDRMQSS